MPANEPIRVHGHKLWVTYILLALAVITFLAISGGGDRVRYGGVMSGSQALPPTAIETNSSYAPQAMPMRDAYPQYGGEVPASDTREFLKTDYNASVRSRHVQALIRRIETVVRGYSGRIDNTSSSPQNAYLSFVVPASKFEDFRNELERLVNARYISINIQTQNMLPQKVSIENQQKQAEKNLADLKTQRAQAVASHTAATRAIQARIDESDTEQAQLRGEVTTDPARQTVINNRLTELAAERSSLKTQLGNENASYKNTLNSYDEQIKYANQSVAAVKTQDTALMDTVQTVRGSISINWISLWEILLLYLPGYWIPSIFALLGLLVYPYERKHQILPF